MVETHEESVSIKRIMIATDFTAAAEKATDYGKSLSRHFSSEIDIVHVFDPSDVASSDEAESCPSSEERRRICIERLLHVRDGFVRAGLNAQIGSPESHRPAVSLLKWAEERRVDLIITGTESKSGLTKLIIGSTAQHLIRGAKCPVLTIGPNSQIHGNASPVFRNIVYATDFFSEAKRSFAYALMFAQDNGAHLYITHAIEAHEPLAAGGELLDQSFRTELKSLIPKSAYESCHPEILVEDGDAAEVILAVCERVQADLLVLGARKASALLTHIQRGLTPRLLQCVSCPILTVT